MRVWGLAEQELQVGALKTAGSGAAKVTDDPCLCDGGAQSPVGGTRPGQGRWVTVSLFSL